MFDIPLLIYFFTKEHPLKTSNKRTQIALLINQFVSLIPDLGVSTAIINLVDIFCRWCKLNFGPVRDQVK